MASNAGDSEISDNIAAMSHKTYKTNKTFKTNMTGKTKKSKRSKRSKSKNKDWSNNIFKFNYYFYPFL